jgi:bisphosphoglycerate-dependent phosphoglycerate mutase
VTIKRSQNVYVKCYIVIRHGEGVSNFFTKPIDASLTQTGINQAINAGSFFSSIIKLIDIHNIFISDLSRTAQTANYFIEGMKQIIKHCQVLTLFM